MLLVFVPAYEGTVNEAYLDPIGIPTICTGHTGGVKLGMRLSDAECALLLSQDLGIALRAVDSLVTAPMTDGQRAAYASFVFNIGARKFRTSTMLRKANAYDRSGSCAEFDRWMYAGGRDCRIRLNNCIGLVDRRSTERFVCETY